MSVGDVMARLKGRPEFIPLPRQTYHDSRDFGGNLPALVEITAEDRDAILRALSAAQEYAETMHKPAAFAWGEVERRLNEFLAEFPMKAGQE